MEVQSQNYPNFVSVLWAMSDSECSTTDSTPESDLETIDRFCIVFLVLPLLPLTFERWAQIAEERCCNSFGCGREQFATIRAFAFETLLTPDALFLFDRQFIHNNGMLDLFNSYFDIPESQYLPHVRLWAKFVRNDIVEAKLMLALPFFIFFYTFPHSAHTHKRTKKASAPCAFFGLFFYQHRDQNGTGLGVFARAHLAPQTPIPICTYRLVLVSECKSPRIGPGRIESYAHFAEQGLFYLAGPGLLLNGACAKCANATLDIDYETDTSTQHAITISEISRGEELCVDYGAKYRADMFCCRCSCAMALETKQQAHVPLDARFRPADFNESNTGHYIASLHAEAQMYYIATSNKNQRLK
jgi:hypothetical protein